MPDTPPDPRFTPLADRSASPTPHAHTPPQNDPQRQALERFIAREVSLLWVGMVGNMLAAIGFMGLAAWIIISTYRGVSVWPAVLTTLGAIGLYLLIERLADRRGRHTLARLEDMQRTATSPDDDRAHGHDARANPPRAD
ncbi:MAG: hypothetical protein KF864_02445 [Phycisphaeraceae bacterium]|nr:hypothetical protein [Phycisphaeraceae bacterium]